MEQEKRIAALEAALLQMGQEIIRLEMMINEQVNEQAGRITALESRADRWSYEAHEQADRAMNKAERVGYEADEARRKADDAYYKAEDAMRKAEDAIRKAEDARYSGGSSRWY